MVTNTGKFLQTNSSKLFVRPCYPALFALCKTKWTAGADGIFLYGTPGIGKSCFLDYALHRCLYDVDKKNVLYLHGPRLSAFIFQHAGAGGTITVAEYSLTEVINRRIEIPSDSFDIVFYDPHESAERTNDVHII